MSQLDPYGNQTPNRTPDPWVPDPWMDQPDREPAGDWPPRNGRVDGPYTGSGDLSYSESEAETAAYPQVRRRQQPPAEPEPEPVRPRRPGPGKRRATGRAGRNLPAAIGVGVTLGAVVIASLFVWRPAFLAVIVIALGVAIWEMSRAVRAVGAHPPAVPLAAGGLVTIGMAWYAGEDALLLGFVVTLLATLVWRLADGLSGYGRDAAAATLIAVYVPFLGGFAALLAEPDDGARRVIVTLAAVVLSDTGGYVAGVFFGKHPMAPTISPKKSWEGLAGSLVATAVGSAILLFVLLDVEPWWGAVFGLALSVVSVLGDLTESMLKRDLGIKDMSNLLPGHGGLMDRLDSILFALPAAYLLLAIFT
ncbi:phosphatidate cytidylyltransferase [Phytohabitans sp. ZYX-F-186]|uniref:Phosphatidate cytidylyltransferase n=1 Tax=Phytohabitans maris TaxID=3071409 RepID=A0ABU0ZLX9_9ACTN|nr:phosphatidate cytidylyltransferase [Phytohabitans sp. ZYX-F-186]MDQ7907265.1 phosphatidate cytidylyltransferase [Phytohabitans sp. ZYX-F-186]